MKQEEGGETLRGRVVWQFIEKSAIHYYVFVLYFWNVVMVLCNHNYYACFFGVLQFSLQIVQLDTFPHSHPFSVKCSFLTPRDQRHVFVVCCSIHIPAPSSLPSFLCPHCSTSPGSLGHESLTLAHTQQQQPSRFEWTHEAGILLWTLPCISTAPWLSLLVPLNSLLARQLVPGCLSNFKVWFWFWDRSRTFVYLIQQIRMSLVGKW